MAILQYLQMARYELSQTNLENLGIFFYYLNWIKTNEN